MINRTMEELKKRHVFRVAGLYAVVGWLLVQVASVALPGFGAPGWALSFFILMVALGFPLALVLAWALELTPDGIRPMQKGTDASANKSVNLQDYSIIGLVCIIAIASVYQIIDKTGETVSEQNSTALKETYDGNTGLKVTGISGRAAIAVLPFTNASNDTSQDYFTDGITIDIIARLQSLRLFPIISKKSSFALRDETADSQTVGEKLGATYVVEGTVRRSQNRIRITAQLTEARTGYAIWTETYDHEAGDLFDLQDKITLSIASALEPELKRSEMLKARAGATTSTTAYDLYLKGLRLSRAENYSEVQTALTNLEAAIALDPKFAPAYVELAWIKHDRITYHSNNLTFEEARLSRDQALAYGEMAISNDPQLAAGHAVYGHMLLHYKKLGQGLASLERSVTLNPSSADSRSQFAWALIVNGRYDEAIQEYQIASQLNPNDPQIWEVYQNIGFANLYSGRFEAAIESTERSLSLNPNNFYAYMSLASGYLGMGERNNAQAAVEKIREIAPNFSTRTLDLTSFSTTQVADFKRDLKSLGWENPT